MERPFLQRSRDAVREAIKRREESPQTHQLLLRTHKFATDLLATYGKAHKLKGEEPYLLIQGTISDPVEPSVNVLISSNGAENNIGVQFEKLQDHVVIKKNGLGRVVDYSDWDHPREVRDVTLDEAREVFNVVKRIGALYGFHPESTYSAAVQA